VPWSGADVGAGAAADGLAYLKALEAVGVLGLQADDAEHLVDHLFALGEVALGPVDARAHVLVHEVAGAEELAERRRAHSADHAGLEVEEHHAGHGTYLQYVFQV
jgi:hypothetical protein